MAERKSSRKPRTPEQREAKRLYQISWRAAHPLTPEQREVKRLADSAYRLLHLEELSLKAAIHYAAHSIEICARVAARRMEHPQEHRARRAAFQIRHREELRVKASIYYAEHVEECRVKNAAYRLEHLEEERIRSANYRAEHQEEIRISKAVWHAEHREQGRAARNRHRALKRGASISDFSAAQWQELQAACDHRCAYCGRRAKGHLTQDHITPLSKGGNHTLANIIPSCQSCNSKKGVGEVLVPTQPMFLTLAPSKKKVA